MASLAPFVRSYRLHRGARERRVPRRPYAAIGIAGAMIALALLCVTAYKSIENLRGAVRLVDHAREVLVEVEALNSLCSDAVIASRSYLITGDEKYGREFFAAEQTLRQKEPSLGRLAADDPVLRGLLADFFALEREDLAAMRSAVAGTLPGASANAAEVVRRLSSLQPGVGRLNAVAQQMKDHENGLLVDSVTQSDESAAATLGLIFIGTTLSLATLLMCFGAVRLEGARRARVERELGKSEERFRSLAQSAADGIISCDPQGTIVFWNTGACEIFGYPEKEALGMSVADLIAPSARSELLQRLAQCMADAHSSRSRQAFECTALHKGGGEMPVEVSAARWAVEGERFLTVVVRDISRRRKAEEELRGSEERFRLIIENVVDYALVMLDPQGRVVSWNIGAERIKGYRPDEIMGRHFAILYTPEDIVLGKPQEQLDRAAREGRSEDEGPRVRKDGTTFWASTVITPMRDAAGRLRGYAKVTRDLTERKRAQEAVQHLNADLRRRTRDLTVANADLERFSYSVAHDLRAPVRHILGYCAILVDDHGPEFSEAARRCVEKVQESASRMGALVDDLLKLAQVGRAVPAYRPVELNAVVDEVVQQLKPEYDGRQIEWHIEAMPDVMCDPVLVKQLFINLLSNAVKYTRPRERAVIDVGSEAGGDGPVFHVADNGVGFDMKHASKLFGVFERLHSAHEFEGTGVGLAIVERIVRSHGGRVWAQAEPDRGATIYFTLEGGAARYR